MLPNMRVLARIGRCWPSTSRAFAAAPVSAKIMPPTPVAAAGDQDRSFVDTDAKKLSENCCVIWMKGGKDIKLGEDKDYPEWLWTLDTEPRIPSTYLDPEIDGWAYWRQRQKEHRKIMSRRYYCHLVSWYVQSGVRGTIHQKDNLPYAKDRYQNKRVRKSNRSWARETGAAMVYPSY